MTLKEYLENNKMTLREIGEITGIDFRVIHRYVSNQSLPNLTNAFKIYKHTNKKVNLIDWFDKEEKDVKKS